MLIVLTLALSSIISLVAPSEAQNTESRIKPLSIQFTVQNGSVLQDTGNNFNVGVGILDPNTNLIITFELHSVSYRASWKQGITPVYQLEKGYSRNSFFFPIELTNVPAGPQEIEVTVESEGLIYGKRNDQALNNGISTSKLHFTISPIQPTENTSQNWTVETVDATAAKLSLTCPIVVDSSNLAHIAYTALIDGTYFVMHTTASRTGFCTQAVAIGVAYSLALDSKSYPHILYGHPQQPLMYASWTGKEWVSQEVVGSFGTTGGLLALDSTDKPHIVYSDGSSVKYVSWTGSNWSIQNLSISSSQLSLAIAPNNTPNLLFNDNGNMKLATLQNSNWLIQNITHASSIGNMVLDSKGYPHLIYKLQEFTDRYNTTLVYANWNGAAWCMQRVISNIQLNEVFLGGYLALDSQDSPHVVYMNSYTSKTSSEALVTYAVLRDGVWVMQTLSPNVNLAVTGPCYLAMDPSGNPNINYQTTFQNITSTWPSPLIYATTEESTLTFTPVTTSAPSFVSSLTLPLILITVASVLVIAMIVYVWKRRKPTCNTSFK
jgi:hypothetical protein